MFVYILIAAIIGVAIGVIVSSLRRQGNNDQILSILEQKVNEVFPKAMQSASQQLILMARQSLVSEKNEIKTDLSNKKGEIEKMVKRLLDELTESNKKLELAERDRIGSFSRLAKELEAQRRITDQLSATTEGLSKVLSNNQLRGQFGEQVAEDLLKMAGFVKGVDYEFNKDQSSGSRPDFSIFLPDGMRINVDSKFPYSNLRRAIETKDKEAKKEYQRAFEHDIKEKIKQVTSRDYINPEENTVDFVIMFIPNEMIFSFVYDKMNEIWTQAMRQKVIMAGPFSFTAILRMVRQAYDNFKYQKNVQKIISQIKIFESEFDKYNSEFEKIGDRIASLLKQYQKVDVTRSRKLLKTIDKIKLEEPEASQLLPLAEENEKSKT